MVVPFMLCHESALMVLTIGATDLLFLLVFQFEEEYPFLPHKAAMPTHIALKC